MNYHITRLIPINLKRSYTISFDEETAKRIEAIKEKTRKTYKEIFSEAINNHLEGNKNIILEFIGFLERNEMKIVQDVDTIRFMIEGLKKKGIQYILEDRKDWEEHPNQ